MRGRISSILVQSGFIERRNQNDFQYRSPFPFNVPFPEIVNPSSPSAFTKAMKYFKVCPSIRVIFTGK